MAITRQTLDRMMRRLGVGYTKFQNVGILLSVLWQGKVFVAGEPLALVAAQKQELAQRIVSVTDTLSTALDEAAQELE